MPPDTMSGMKSKLICGAFLLAVSSISGQTPRTLSLADLLSAPGTYDGKLVRLNACAVRGLEQFGVRTCESAPSFSTIVCLDSFEHADDENRVLGHRGPVHGAVKRSATEQRLYKRLMAMRNGTRLKVELEGEFQNSDNEAFGPGCSRRIIVLRVFTLAPE